jgi:hypothetical protein
VAYGAGGSVWIGIAQRGHLPIFPLICCGEFYRGISRCVWKQQSDMVLRFNHHLSRSQVMREITRRQLLGATALSVSGVALWGLSGPQTPKVLLQPQGLTAVMALDVAVQQLFDSVNVVAPQNLVQKNG